MRGGVRVFPMPVFPKDRRGFMWCKWCGESIPLVIDGKRSTQRLWHPPCVHQYELHTRLSTQREHVAKRDGDCCAICGEAPERWLNQGETVDFRQAPSFKHLAVVGSDEWLELRAAWYRDNPNPVYCSIERVSALELDHRVPLWSVADLEDAARRWYFGPQNLWLLCPLHHKQKTRREAQERAGQRAFVKAQLTLF